MAIKKQIKYYSVLFVTLALVAFVEAGGEGPKGKPLNFALDTLEDSVRREAIRLKVTQDMNIRSLEIILDKKNNTQ